MTKFLIVLLGLTNNILAMQSLLNAFRINKVLDSKTSEDKLKAIRLKKKTQKIILKNKEELLKIIKPGLQSIISGACIRNSNKLDSVGSINLLALSNCGKYIALKNRSEKICDFSDFNNLKLMGLEGTKATGNSMQIRESGCYIIMKPRLENVKIWDITDFNNKKFIELGDTDTVRCLAFSEYAKRLVTSHKDDKIKIWDLSVLSNISSIEIAGRADFDIAINRLGNCIVTDEAIIYDISDLGNIKLIRLEGHADRFYKVTISNCGRFIVAGSIDVVVWDISDINAIKSVMLRKHCHGINTIAISNCNKYVFTGSDDINLIVWDISDFENIKFAQLDCEMGSESMAINKYDNVIVTRNFDNSVFVRDLSVWLIDDLSLSQLRILRTLTSDTNPELILKYYKENKKNFNKNMQSYIERYLRNKFAVYYLTLANQTSWADINNIVNSYL